MTSSETKHERADCARLRILGESFDYASLIRGSDNETIEGDGEMTRKMNEDDEIESTNDHDEEVCLEQPQIETHSVLTHTFDQPYRLRACDGDGTDKNEEYKTYW
jgi:hypothetical protein